MGLLLVKLQIIQNVIHIIILLTIFSSLVYDITKRSSFLSIQRWIEEVRRYTTSDVILILIGNKCDLEEEREVNIIKKFNKFKWINRANLIKFSGRTERGSSFVSIHTRNIICYGNVRKRKYKYQRHILFISNRTNG